MPVPHGIHLSTPSADFQPSLLHTSSKTEHHSEVELRLFPNPVSCAVKETRMLFSTSKRAGKPPTIPSWHSDEVRVEVASPGILRMKQMETRALAGNL